MSEPAFTQRIETSLKHGMASVPMPAPAPAAARYRNVAGQVVRRPATRVAVAIGTIGAALLASLGAAAATEASPATLASTAVHSIQVLVAHVLAPDVGEPASVAPAPVDAGAVESLEPPTPQAETGRDEPDPSGQPGPAPAAVPLPGPEPETARQGAGASLKSSPEPSRDSPKPDPSCSAAATATTTGRKAGDCA